MLCVANYYQQYNIILRNCEYDIVLLIPILISLTLKPTLQWSRIGGGGSGGPRPPPPTLLQGISPQTELLLFYYYNYCFV